MKKTFGYNGGYQIRGISAQVVGETLDNIVEKKGVLNAKTVLDEAKDTKHLLHNYFEWDDKLAAEEYRIQQANYLIRSIKVNIIDDDKKTNFEIKKAFTHLKAAPEKGYIPTERIFKDTKLTMLMLNQAQKELIEWKERYKDLLELSSIFNAINIYFNNAG